MTLTGYQLMDRIETLREQAQTINGQFTRSLYRFPDDSEVQPDPRDLMQRYLAVEKQISALQAAQAIYNAQVRIDVQGEALSLQQAVKIIGSATRIKTNWITASTKGLETGTYDRYGDKYSGMVRAKENVYAVRVVGIDECLSLSEAASEYASALKQAIRAGNATLVEMDLDPALLG